MVSAAEAVQILRVSRSALFGIVVVVRLNMVQVALGCRDVAAGEAAGTVATVDASHPALSGAVTTHLVAGGDTDASCVSNLFFGGYLAQPADAINPCWPIADLTVDIDDNLGIGRFLC